MYFKNDLCKLYLQDTFECLKSMSDETIDVIFADPPYFLSNGGISCSGGKQVKNNKGTWDKPLSLIDKNSFNKQWLSECRRLLKPNGSIWITGTVHNIFSIGITLEELNFKIINNIVWQKTNPPPNLACRCFTNSYENVIWATKGKHYFNYKLMKEFNNNKQMKDIWIGSSTPKSEKTFGKHPTQKPIFLLERILLASTKENDLVLDPFCGSGTTGVVCQMLKRRFIGIDNNEDFLKLSIKRLSQKRGEK